ncbi:MAG: hypothetical protein ACREH3_10720 [Geminicoccales bacterium]
MRETDRTPKRPRHSDRVEAGKAAREARLAEEMRKNLLKRKRQQRAKDPAKPSREG